MPFFTRKIQTPLFAAGLGCLLVFLAVVGVRRTGNMEFLELPAYDWLMRLRPESSAGDSRITVVRVSEEDILSMGRWPITDGVLAQALTSVLKEGPLAVGLDIFRDIPVPPGTETLDAVLSKNPNIIAPMKFGDGGVRPPPVLNRTDQVGFNDILVDPGGVVRRGLLFLDDGDGVAYSFALRLALVYLQARGIVPQPDARNPQHLRLGNVTFRPFEANDGGYVKADARGYQFFLDYQDPVQPFQSYSLADLLSGKIPPTAVNDKIVLIGVTAQSVKDFFYTPYSRGLSEAELVPGLTLHGLMVSQLLKAGLEGLRPMETLAEREEVLWILLWSLLGGIVGLKAHSAWRFSLVGSAGVLLLGVLAYAAFLHRLWIPLAPPALAFLLSAALAIAYVTSLAKKERALLMQIFSKHVSREVAESLWKQRELFMKNGRPRSQKLIITSFFSDLRGFTTVSEKMDPQDLMDWLNLFMERMTEIIMAHGGIIDDFAGDGIKANFGLPLPEQSDDRIRADALSAVRSALDMEKEMHRLKARWQEKGLPEVGMRIGIYTGPAVAGGLGSFQRMKYTTVGNTVNIASRLESYDKDVGKDALCRILIGESTLGYLGPEFRTERIGEVHLKGKEERITVYRLLGEDGSLPQARNKEVSQ
ncbi:MAG: CHASE2 domain-containing protein [Deltaproteobacteria bacterium]